VGEEPRRVQWLWIVVAAVWCGLIALTSSTVILPHDFFNWMASHAISDEVAYGAFVGFWKVCWFPIVKGWHAAEFAILFAVTLLALDRFFGRRRPRNILVGLAVCLLFAVSDEFHQTFVPGRGGTWVDVSIDAFGAGLAGLIAWLRRGRLSSQNGDTRRR
jgi:hypothetical protein